LVWAGILEPQDDRIDLFLPVLRETQSKQGVEQNSPWGLGAPGKDAWLKIANWP
jgi:hypothetical protein